MLKETLRIKMEVKKKKKKTVPQGTHHGRQGAIKRETFWTPRDQHFLCLQTRASTFCNHSFPGEEKFLFVLGRLHPVNRIANMNTPRAPSIWGKSITLWTNPKYWCKKVEENFKMSIIIIFREIQRLLYPYYKYSVIKYWVIKYLKWKLW